MVLDGLVAVRCDQSLQLCPHGPILLLLLGPLLTAPTKRAREGGGVYLRRNKTNEMGLLMCLTDEAGQF